jgi:hypothetical protein
MKEIDETESVTNKFNNIRINHKFFWNRKDQLKQGPSYDNSRSCRGSGERASWLDRTILNGPTFDLN